MTFEGWLTLAGLLFLAMSLSSAWVRRLPVSTAALYLLCGAAIGPWALNLIDINVVRDSHYLLRLTEVGVVFSLFIGGLRLRLPLDHRAWRAAFRLASLLMVLSIGALAWLLWQFLHFPPPVALLIAAILAPTDPVLASDVTVGHSQDEDRLRYALSGEAGLNDGAAFPFVTLALLMFQGSLDTHEWLTWVGKDLLWASAAGLVVGFILGRLVGRLAIVIRSRERDTAAPTDFLVLALMALSYVAAQAIGAWGFLAVFAAGVGLRRAEIQTVAADPHPEVSAQSAEPHPPAETLVAPNTVTEDEMKAPAVAAGVLVAEVFSFGDTAERIMEVLLVVTIGVALATHLTWPGLITGALLIFVVRPAMTALSLLGTPTNARQRALIGWFGIRGIGSLYYLAFIVAAGLPLALSREIADICVSAVGLSIVAHGLSVQPLMEWYGRQKREAQRA